MRKKREKRRKLNGKRRRVEATLRPVIEQARGRVIAYARKYGGVSSSQAATLLGTSQSYYHLKCLAEQGLLVHAGYNLWSTPDRSKTGSGRKSTKARGRPAAGFG